MAYRGNVSPGIMEELETYISGGRQSMPMHRLIILRWEKKQELPQFSEMCTTVAGCVFRENGTIIFHAGDRRFLLRQRFPDRRTGRH